MPLSESVGRGTSSSMVEITIGEAGEVLEEKYKDHLCRRCGDPCDCEFHLARCSRCLRCRAELDSSEGG